MMKRLYFSKSFVLLFIVNAFFLSCKNENNEIEALKSACDSLENLNAKSSKELSEMNSYVFSIAQGLDSIAQQENVISSGVKEGVVMSKSELKVELAALEALVKRQRQQISALEDSLQIMKNRGENAANLYYIVDFLNQQLAEKSATIAELRLELDKKNSDIKEQAEHIAKLKGNVSALNRENSSLRAQNQSQVEALQVQDEVINECYVVCATKKQLKDWGLVTGGSFLSKKKVVVDNIDKSKFTAVNIAHFKEMTIPSKSVEILTQMPTDSYKITPDGKNCVLTILNATKFWSVSNFLIIQTK